MAYITDPSGGAGQTGEVHTTQKNPLGAVRLFSDGNSYIYLPGCTNGAANAWVKFDKSNSYATTLLATGLKGSVAIQSATADATTEYCWCGYIGTFTATCESSIVSNANVYTTATAGEVDDAIVEDMQVLGAITRSAGVAAATATVDLSPAWVGATSASA